MNNPKKQIILSGMMRSGTTLLQRVVDCHPALNVDYQSKTDIFLNIKKQFLKELQINQYHLLTHYNPVSGYTFPQFNNWLNQNNDMLESVFPSQGSGGVKEVLIEEFYPTLLDMGVYCLNIIRDPRDVVASMSFGNGEIHTGAERPVLFDIRNWRKSVHIAHKLSSHSHFMSIIFERFILDKDKVVSDIFEWLGVSELSANEVESLLNKSSWKGNSSFGSKKAFDSSSVNTYATRLPQEVINYIEAVCYQELEHLGYGISIEPSQRREIITNYKDPFEVKRKEFDPTYSSNVENIEYELDRLQLSFQDLNTRFKYE